MKIDAHQHFWFYNSDDYSWIGDNMHVIRNSFLPFHLQKELSANNFDGSIVVQARQTLDETRWLLNLANQHDFIKGVVGWVDLCSSSVDEQLMKFSLFNKFVGVRHVVHDEPDDSFMNRSDFQNGIRLLSKYRLTYDLLLFPKHLPLATQLVQKFPEQKFVLDHIAKPFIKAGKHSPWDADIAELASHPNVYCKLSGMVTEADWDNWKPSDFTFYLDTVFNCFGKDRLMIGSDWPVCTVAGNYKKVISVVTDYIQQFSPSTQDKIMGENCAKFYL